VPFTGWIAGSGSLEEAVRAAVAEAGLNEHVELLGRVDASEVAERLRATGALIVTSLWEGQPRAVLEALGCGAPVVAPPVGDVPEIVVAGVSGYVASGSDAVELAELAARAVELRDPASVAATVSAFRASEVVGGFFADLEQL
jgi:UDP-glucose:(heptosyl)LPS alpha-1,3-glucosyltransferase